MNRKIKMIVALWPFYVIFIVIISFAWALYQKPKNSEINTAAQDNSAATKRLADHMDAISAAKQFVLKNLKAPSTAKFPPIMDFSVTQKNADSWLVTGFVDAQNSFGAMLRQQFTCTVRRDSDRWYLLNLKLN